MSKITVLESWIEILNDLLDRWRSELAAVWVRSLVWQTQRSVAERLASPMSDAKEYLAAATRLTVFE